MPLWLRSLVARFLRSHSSFLAQHGSPVLTLQSAGAREAAWQRKEGQRGENDLSKVIQQIGG